MKKSVLLLALLGALGTAQAATIDLGQGLSLSSSADLPGFSGSLLSDGSVMFDSGFNGSGDADIWLQSSSSFSVQGLSVSAFYQFDPVTISGYNEQGLVGQYTVSANCCWDIAHPQVAFDGITSLHFSGFLGVYGQVKPITTPVPEPETWAMLVAGLGLSGLATRRRRRA